MSLTVIGFMFDNISCTKARSKFLWQYILASLCRPFFQPHFGQKHQRCGSLQLPAKTYSRSNLFIASMPSGGTMVGAVWYSIRRVVHPPIAFMSEAGIMTPTVSVILPPLPIPAAFYLSLLAILASRLRESSSNASLREEYPSALISSRSANKSS